MDLSFKEYVLVLLCLISEKVSAVCLHSDNYNNQEVLFPALEAQAYFPVVFKSLFQCNVLKGSISPNMGGFSSSKDQD